MNSAHQRITRRKYLALMAAATASALAPSFCHSENSGTPLRVAISAETLAGANINDARAAYRIWLAQVALQYGIQAAVAVPDVFIPSEDLIRDVRLNKLDCFGITALELAQLADLTEPGNLVIQDYLADGIEYVLLVHNSSPYKRLPDLRDAHILSHLHRDLVLLPAWLSTMLSAFNLPRPDRFFASHKLNGSLNQVVLPVFFRRVDGACLTRHSWKIAVELNPQLGKDLRPLAVSPRLIPIVFGFRNNASAEARKRLIDAIQRVNSVVAGQQIVALYQSRSLVVRPLSVMKSTLEMVRQSERISAQQPTIKKGTA